MSWYANMRISAKLISGFVLIALLFGITGLYCIHQIKGLNQSNTDLYEKMTVPLTMIGQIDTEFNRIRVDARDVVIAQTPEEIQAVIDRIETDNAAIDELSDAYAKTIDSEEMQKEFDIFVEAEDIYEEELDKVVVLALQNKDAEATVLISPTSRAAEALAEEKPAIANMIAMKTADAEEMAANNAVMAEQTVTLVTAIILAVILLSIFLGYMISWTISKPCKKTMFMLGELSQGHFGERVNLNRNDELGQMAKIMDDFAEALQTKVIYVMNRISEGDVSMDIVLMDDRDEIAPAMKRMVETIRAMRDDVSSLIRDVGEGKLDSEAMRKPTRDPGRNSSLESTG